MNNRLVSRVKALNFTVDNFPIFTEENSERYIDLKFKLTSSLMRRDIEKVVKKYPNRPKLKIRLLNMYNAYNDLIYNEIMTHSCKNIELQPTITTDLIDVFNSKRDQLVSVEFNSSPLFNPIAAKPKEFLDYINKFIK